LKVLPVQTYKQYTQLSWTWAVRRHWSMGSWTWSHKCPQSRQQVDDTPDWM